MYDLIILGGGPAGAAVGVYAARKKINFILLTDTFGGQSVVSDDIQNWIGIPHISGWEMAKRLKEHLEAVGAPFKEGVKISGMKKAEDGFEIAAESSEIYKTKTVLVALGSSRKKLKIPGEAEFNGKGVFYCATCDAPLMKDKISAVIGGGNAAVGAVIDLLSYASKIYLLVRSDILKADPIAIDQIKNHPKVEIIFNAESQEIKGDKPAPYQPQKEQRDKKGEAEGDTVRENKELTQDASRFGSGFVESLVYLNKISGEKKELKLDGIFVEIGSRPNSEFLKDLINMNERGEIIVDCQTKKTSCEGVWAAGDITNRLYKQNTISLGDGVVALLNIYDYLIKKIESRK